MEEPKSPIEIVFDYLTKEEKPKLSGSTVKVGSETISNKVKSLINNEDLCDKLGIFRYTRSSSFSLRDFCSSVSDFTKKVISKKAQDKAAQLIGESGKDVDPSLFRIFKDIEEESDRNDKDKFLVLSEDNSIVKDVSISTYRHLITEEVYKEIRPKIPLAYREFNPYLINETLQDKSWRAFRESFQADILHINTCKHPDWRYNRDLDAKLTDKEINFIESCFLNKSDLQYYIDAAYHTIVDKMWSYIMLYGIKGTGKTTLIEMLIPCVGKENYRKAPQTALQSDFNGFKRDKRLILMDEMVANTDKAINLLKSDANKEFNVEEKHQISQSVKNFVSMWIATNNISDWKFTHDERRFSTIELTSKTTKERGISDEFMSELSQKIESEYWANAFFNYLEKNKSENFNTMSPYKTDIFYRVVYESLKPWQMKIVDEITLGEKRDSIFISDLFEEKDRFQPATHKVIMDFLDNYRHEGKKLGTYSRGRSVRSSEIIPIEKYRPKKREDGDLE